MSDYVSCMADGMKDTVTGDTISALQAVHLPGDGRRVLQLVFETFGETKGRRWLAKENRVFDGKAPEDMLHTDDGAGAVEKLLHRIAHGLGA